jgi:hypothetical protein
MLCAMMRRVPAARAASTRLRVPAWRIRVGVAAAGAQVGQLVDDDVGGGGAHRAGERGRVEDVGQRGLGAKRAHPLGRRRRPGEAGDLVPRRGQERDEAAADDAGRAGQKDSHVGSPHGRIVVCVMRDLSREIFSRRPGR